MSDEELGEFVLSENGKQTVTNSMRLPIDYEILDNGLTPLGPLKKIQIPKLIITSPYGLTTAEYSVLYLSDCVK
jgi:hypothetical protein